MSGAPIISGSTKFAEPGEDRDDEQEDHQRRVDRERGRCRCCASTNCMPGCASSARMSIASSPPTRKKKNVVTMYWIADHLVVGVDPEVVLPASARRGRSGPRAASGARRPVEPVVEAADADEEAERRDDHARRRRGSTSVFQSGSQPHHAAEGDDEAACRGRSRERPSTRRGRARARRAAATSSRAAARSAPGTRLDVLLRMRRGHAPLLLDPLVELGLGHDPRLRAHRRVAEPAELGADDGELTGARRRDEDRASRSPARRPSSARTPAPRTSGSRRRRPS